MTVLDSTAQHALFTDYATDPRGRTGTGLLEMDSLLHRGGMAAGELVLLGGRTRTRKTTVMLNLVANMIVGGTPVGLVGLDEAKHSYVGKLLSVWTGLPMAELEQGWNGKSGSAYPAWARNLTMYGGPLRPSFEDLTVWLLEAENLGQARPKVVFIDYLSLLGREKFDGAEVQRVHRLVENLQVWTATNRLVTIALHQVGRAEEGVGIRYHGDTPLALEGLKYGGEEIADIVLATYRPALDPTGNMTWEMARKHKGDKYDYDQWAEAVMQARAATPYTYLQLLKNRPGVHTHERGIRLRSIGESMQMEVDAMPADLEKVQAYG